MTEMSLKLRRLDVSGYRALQEFSLIPGGPLQVMIGSNGAGKSSILQLVDFIYFFATGNSNLFFGQRHWDPRDTRSFFQTRETIDVELQFECSSGLITWSFVWDVRKQQTRTERITTHDGGEEIEVLYYAAFGKSAGLRLRGKRAKLGDVEIKSFRYEGSVLAQFADVEITELSALRAWANSIHSLELLNPAEMRAGTRGTPSYIGKSGRELVSYFDVLDTGAQRRVLKRLNEFYPNAKSLTTIRRRAGWVVMDLRESFAPSGRLDATAVSDGFLRLLALSILPEFSPTASVLLLDEIEDGIEPHLLPKVISLLRSSGCGLVLASSHSPSLVNLLDPEEVVFVVRNEVGHAKAVPLSRVKALTDHLDQWGPGEIWGMLSGDKVYGIARAAAAKVTE